MSHAAHEKEWFGRDHALVMEAAGNLSANPIYARHLWEQAEDPATAALFLIDLFMRDRVGDEGPPDDTRHRP